LHQQSGAADGGARRRQLGKSVAQGDEAMKITKVGEKDLRLDHVIERGAGGLEGLFQVVEDVCRLQFDIRAVEWKAPLPARLPRNAGLEIARQLTGGEYEIANDERLAVIGERARNGRSDDLVREPLARHVGDEIDLDQRIGDQQSGAADGGARRRHLKVALPQRIEAVEVGEISEKDLRLDHVIERGAGGLEGLLQIFEDVRRLQLDVR